jgi:hypothetical protein
MRSGTRFALFLGVALMLLGGAATAADSEARKIVNQARQDTSSIQEQSEALVRLAWLDPDQPPEVRAIARDDLVIFGKHGLGALVQAVRLVEPRFSMDVAATLLQARLQIRAQIPPTYASALDQLLWYGTADAKRLAIPEMARAGFFPAMHACVDAAYDHPELTLLVIRLLPEFKSDQLRHSLADFLQEGSREEQQAAAESLARMGGRALENLRQATLSDDPELRRLAMEAFLPASRVSDLTALYEFISLVPDEEPEFLERVRQRAVMLEELLEEMQDADAASAVPGD